MAGGALESPEQTVLLANATAGTPPTFVCVLVLFVPAIVVPGVLLVEVVGGVRLVRGTALDTARADTSNKLPSPIARVKTVGTAFLSRTSTKRLSPL